MNRLARKGCVVVAGVRQQRDYDKVSAVPNVFPIYWDITNKTSTRQAVATAVRLSKEKQLRLIGLVANAGIGGVWGKPLEWYRDEEFEKVITTNLFGTASSVMEALPYLRQSKGRVVIVGSIMGLFAAPGTSAYSSSKHAVDGLASSIRREVHGLGVSVSIINAGCVKSSFFGKTAEEEDTLILRNKSEPAYERLLDAAVKYNYAGACDATAGSTDESSDSIEHALTSRYPKTRYYPGTAFGLPARLTVFICSVLPTRLLDLYTAYGLSLQHWILANSWMQDHEQSFEERVSKSLSKSSKP